MPNVVTANRLTDGIVVYLAPDGGWTEEIARARFAETEDETKRARGRGRQGREGRAWWWPSIPWRSRSRTARVDPLSVRERIRAAHRTTLTKDWYDVPL